MKTCVSGTYTQIDKGWKVRDTKIKPQLVARHHCLNTSNLSRNKKRAMKNEKYLLINLKSNNVARQVVFHVSRLFVSVFLVFHERFFVARQVFSTWAKWKTRNNDSKPTATILRDKLTLLLCVKYLGKASRKAVKTVLFYSPYRQPKSWTIP